MNVNEIHLPLTNIGRKYGYITWKKKYDDQLKSFFGNAAHVNFQVGETVQKKKRIDWRKRRIGITYTLTRNLPESNNKIRLKKTNNGKLFQLFFE